MATEASNNIKQQIAEGNVDFANDAFRLILMDNSFVFDEDTDYTYADIKWTGVAGLEHDDTNTGYTLQGAAMALTGAPVIDTANDRYEIFWNTVSWVAGSAGLSSKGACIIHGTGADADYVVGFIDFDATQTVANGGTLTVTNISVYIT